MPPIQVVYTGKTAILTCTTSVEPTWKKSRASSFNYVVTSKYDGSKETIAIISVNSKHEGVYYCNGRNLKRKKFKAMAEIYVGG